MSKEAPFWGIILAGESKRFKESRGIHKALYPLDNEPIVERIYKSISSLSKDTYIVTPLPGIFSHLKIPLITDEGQGEGPLRGVYTALGKFPRIFLVGCDMPFPSIPLLLYLKSIFDKGYDIVGCRIRGIIQPFFAFYSDNILPLIGESMGSAASRVNRLPSPSFTAGTSQQQSSNYSLTSLFDNCHSFIVEENEARKFDPALSSFLNFNV